jgi:hypothetical protein
LQINVKRNFLPVVFNSFFFSILDYKKGPSVKDSASSVCSVSFGTLDWAKEQCDNDVSCKWLHDFGCDDKNWRFCPNVDLDNYKGAGTKGCSQIKPYYEGNFNMLYLKYDHHKFNYSTVFVKYFLGFN